MSTNGKGSKQRPAQVDRKAFEENWERTFTGPRCDEYSVLAGPALDALAGDGRGLADDPRAVAFLAHFRSCAVCRPWFHSRPLEIG